MSPWPAPRLLRAEHLRLIRSSLAQRSASYLGMIDAENDAAMLLAGHEAPAEQTGALQGKVVAITRAAEEFGYVAGSGTDPLTYLVGEVRWLRAMMAVGMGAKGAEGE